MKLIVNADDFGFSKGVNYAVHQAHTKGIVNSASLMVNQRYTKEAVDLIPSMPNLKIGLHLNLTNGKAISPKEEVSLLVDEQGNFCCGFVKLLVRSLLYRKVFTKQIETEVENQIKHALALGVNLSHIDSHRHVHTIPLIFNVVTKLQKKYDIARLRIINENMFSTMFMREGLSYLTDGGIIKYAVLRLLSFWNNYKTKNYFFSILYTCKITDTMLKKIQNKSGYDAIEIMVHPGCPEMDKEDEAGVPDVNLLSPYRTIELNSVLNKEILK